MNTFLHFLVGYFLARKCKYKHDQFQTFFFSFAAILPDLDLFLPIEHATWTHTLLIGLVMALGFVAITEIISFKFLKKIQFLLSPMLIYAFIALLSHFFLDIFTYVHEDCATTDAHQYLWPWVNLSFHMNCLWSGVEYWHRVVIEWVFVFPPLVLWMLYNWIKKGENLFHVLSPKHWKQYINPAIVLNGVSAPIP